MPTNSCLNEWLNGWIGHWKSAIESQRTEEIAELLSETIPQLRPFELSLLWASYKYFFSEPTLPRTISSTNTGISENYIFCRLAALSISCVKAQAPVPWSNPRPFRHQIFVSDRTHGPDGATFVEGRLEVKLLTISTDGKAEVGRVREEKNQRRERVKRKSQKKEDAGARKGRKVAVHCVFPMVCGSGGSKSRLAKAAGAGAIWPDERRKSARRCGAKHMSKSKCTKHVRLEALSGMEMSKKCTPLWREENFQVKSVKNWWVQTTFGSWDVEKVHAVVARSTFPSQNVKSTTCLDIQMSFRVAGARACAPCQKWAKTWGFCSRFKSVCRHGTIEEDLQRCIFRGRHSTTDMFIRDVRRSGRWFPEKRYTLEHLIFSFGKMILCDRCSTWYGLASLFPGRRNTLETWAGKIAKCIGTRPSALHPALHYWRKSRRILSFLMLLTSKIEEISQNCLACALVNFENWGSLADLFRFCTCQVQKLRKSRRIAWFSSLQIAARQIEDRRIDRWMDG